MLERLFFACFMLLQGASCVCFMLGLVLVLERADPRPGLLGGSGLLLCHFLRPLGEKYLHFRDCEATLNAMNSHSALVVDEHHAARASKLAHLLGELDEFDDARAHGTADIWALQQVRREADALIDADPRLQEEFSRQLAQHPELRR